MTNTVEEFVIEKLNIYHVFQPIIRLTDKETIGFEALIRTEEFPNPEVLFQKAREEDSLYQLDMLSIRLACESFKKEGADLPVEDPLLFINIFPSTLSDPAFHDEFLSIFADVGMDYKQVVIEINEREKTNIFALNENVEQLRQIGFRIALDDLGKGNSFVNSLEIETHIAKIDRYYAFNLSDSMKKRLFIQTVMQSFPNDIFIVLEGIETKEDLTVAEDLGVHLAQGFHIGRPGPLKNFL